MNLLELIESNPEHILFEVVGGTTYDSDTDSFVGTFVAIPSNVVLGEN